MKIIYIITIGLLIIVSSCNDTNKKNVKYMATNANSAYNLQYLDSNNELVKTEIIPQSAQDKWSYSYIVDEGDIVYISGNYKDINSSLKIMILIDGKIFKQASNTADTLSYLTVSGTVPY
ncbi:MAG: hypothetical protein HQ521_15140 [Bacteroidetes bacterium]|nr:hypothetical protein [Bacteroidota bacterium]